MPNFAYFSKADTDLVQDGASWVSQEDWVNSHSGWSMQDNVDNEPVMCKASPSALTLTLKDANDVPYESEGVPYTGVAGHNPFRPHE